MSQLLIKPEEELLVVEIDLAQARPTNYLRARQLGMPDGESSVGWLYSSLVAGGKSNYLRKKTLEHNVGKTSFTMPAVGALALVSVAPTASSTGATIVELTYTGYARKKVEGSAWNAAVEAEGKITTALALEFAACTAGSGTAVGWAYLDSTTIGAGNVLYWGTFGSTVISTTATPATFNAGAVIIEES